MLPLARKYHLSKRHERGHCLLGRWLLLGGAREKPQYFWSKAVIEWLQADRCEEVGRELHWMPDAPRVNGYGVTAKFIFTSRTCNSDYIECPRVLDMVGASQRLFTVDDLIRRLGGGFPAFSFLGGEG